MRLRHGAPCRRQPALADELVHKDEAARVRLVLVPHTNRPRGHGRKDVEERRVLSQNIDGAERVEVDRAGPARLAAHQGPHEGAGAVEQGNVVWVRRHAAAVKGDEHVNVGGWLGRVVGSLAAELRRKGAAQQSRDSGFVPFRSHGVGKVGARATRRAVSRWKSFQGYRGRDHHNGKHTGCPLQTHHPHPSNPGAFHSLRVPSF